MLRAYLEPAMQLLVGFGMVCLVRTSTRATRRYCIGGFEHLVKMAS